MVTNQIANETYVLYQCGTPAPAGDAPGVVPDAKLFQIPLTSLSVPETVPYAYIELLGLDDRVHDVSSFVVSPCGQKVLACAGGVASPDAFSYWSNMTALEEAVFPAVDGIIANQSFPEHPRAFAFSSASDPGVLNRVEWIKFLGLFFNRERAATQIFDELSQQYNATREAERRKADAGASPVVAFPAHFAFDGDENYQLSFADYKAQLVGDAGGKMLDKAAIAAVPGVRASAFSDDVLEFAWTGEGAFPSKTAAQAAFLKVLAGADVVVDESYALDPATFNFAAFEGEYGLNATSDAVKASLPWLAPRLVFREDGLLSENAGLGIFEGALVRPDKLLADVARVTNAARDGKLAADDTKFTWVRQIDESPVIKGPDTCERLTMCGAEPTPICPFVAVCGDGSTVLLTSDISDTNQQCTYEACASAGDAEPAGAGGELADASPANNAQMAAPAVILLTLLIVFVEALINFC